MDPIVEFQRLPLVTRSWLGLTLLVTAGVNMDVIPLAQVIMPPSTNWHFVLFKQLELWRLITSFCIAGTLPDTFGIMFLLYNLYVHMYGYERNPFPCGSGSRTADTLWVLLSCAVGIVATIPLLQKYLPHYVRARYNAILTRHLSYAIMYLWARRNPEANMQLNFFPLKGKWLPFAHLGIAYLMHNPLQPLLHGMVVGHVVYFLVYVVPQQTGRRIWRPPSILADLIGGRDGGDVYAEEEEEHMQRRAPAPQARLQQQQAMMQRDGATPAHIAAKSGNLQQLQQLAASDATLPMLGAADRNGWQPLHEAVRGGHMECVEFLVNNHVDIRATTRSGDTPLSLSIRCHGQDHVMTRRLIGLTREATMSGGMSNNANTDDDAASEDE